MALVKPIFALSREADADLSAKQYFLIKNVAGTKMDLAGAGELCLGVLQNDPASGEAGSYASVGLVKVVAGAAVAEGALIAADAAGKAVTATTGDYPVGIARSAAAADGELLEVEMHISLVVLP